MKVKEKMYETRGRPRKFTPGEVVEWKLRAPDSLLLELRICARAGNRSVNEEIVARLMVSLNYRPNRSLIKTIKGEMLISFAAKFEDWLSGLVFCDNEGKLVNRTQSSIDKKIWVWRGGERILVRGRGASYSMRIPENLADEIKLMARIQRRSLNDEILTRLMDSLGYFTERLLAQNDDVQSLKVLCFLFNEFLTEKLEEAESGYFPKNSDE
ncbi:Arc family DNA-binding protein [Pectobacterium brasiliense]|uniref:Arc family DNA-binding protein n=1 Tax=Pectobacterium brasiliense TaxID=180957 RepID=UPI001968DA9B|nr:Arc family DNA-binding protein [Pectobacterium brasiliense]MBN3262967.1 Arc family DNA-binding protein [Pectobacterium brasiliense]